MLPRPVSVFSANFNEKAPFADAAPPEPTGMEAEFRSPGHEEPPGAHLPTPPPPEGHPPPPPQQPNLEQRVTELERKVDEINATFERRIDRIEEMIRDLSYRISQVDEPQYRNLPGFASLGDS